MNSKTTAYRASKLESWELDAASKLRTLFAERPELRQKSFGTQYEIGSAGMVSQYLTAKRPLRLPTAIKFAKGLGVLVEDISPTLAAQLPKQNTPLTPVQQAPAAISFDNAVRVIALKLLEVDAATARRAMGVLTDLATDPQDHERISRATLAVVETGKRRAA